ncbi:hypothetical protein HPP92_003594 [Vanilla planifolia]|uniref:protein-serine/threonine phosphatase n=1 Tax=Vanilla planifolia TaxID=51239 RepID=A0A835SGR4_VANPL|nr:hypothetical protein HPP92_003982 [Vanilla planifolia]KAG0503522.1 hypothetical protein HPP92_003594 [Vanilla planifolia]
MGLCVSSASEVKKGSETNLAYVVGDGGSRVCDDEGISTIASLYSRQGKKGINQDAAIVFQGFGLEDALFCGVFDGHGRNGHIVSRLVRDTLPSLLLLHRADYAYDSSDSDDMCSMDDKMSSASSVELFDEWKEAIITAFKAMDKELRLHPKLNAFHSGTTAVTIIKQVTNISQNNHRSQLWFIVSCTQGRDLIISNLGDSRAVMGTFSEEGLLKAVQLTTDLKPSVPQEAERIRKSNGRVFALRDEPDIQRVWLPDTNFPGLAMARAFGDFELKNYGVIATPQVWDVLTNEQVVKIVWLSFLRGEEASKAVVKAAVRAWRRKYPSYRADDCSAACILLEDR